MSNEILLYQSNDLTERIEVRLAEDTVWLSQQQMATLFQQTKQNISLHINNCFREKELDKTSTVKEYLTVQKEGNRNVRRKIEYYNLDVIISVGYRVKSKQGTQFRIWATNVLKDYLLKGYALNQRMNRVESTVEKIAKKVDEISFQIKKFTQSHDRFIIIDNTEVYHLGASLKDLGKKWFAFAKMDKHSVESILNAITKKQIR